MSFKKSFWIVLLLIGSIEMNAKDFCIYAGKSINIQCDTSTVEPVVNQLSVCLLRIARMYWNLQLWSLPKLVIYYCMLTASF